MITELTSNRKLVQRFVKDYDLPINIFDAWHFEYYASLYDFFPMDAWNCLEKTIRERFDFSAEKWLDYCQGVRDNAINCIKNSKFYAKFNLGDMSQYAVKPPVGERSCYTEETDGTIFLSIDLRKANFQAMKYAGVLYDDTYDDFIERAGGDDYIKGSKYLRQVIFGNCNPSRQVTIEKYLINRVYCLVKDKYLNLDLFSMNSDEVVFKLLSLDALKDNPNVIREALTAIEREIKIFFNINVKAELFQVKKLRVVNSENDNVDAYVKHNLVDGTEKLKKASTLFFPQIYKLWKGLNITSTDREFYAEHQLATFNKELVLKENN